jgi:hypothetical protein
MIFVDLVSSISRALPSLVAVSARRPHDEMVFGAKVGYAFVSPNTSRAGELIGIENENAWYDLQAATLGILGTSRIGQAVARITSQRFGADVICHHSTASTDSEVGDWGRRHSFDDVIAARAICLVLPWSADLLGQIQRNKLTQVNFESVLVVWRRSLAIERALIYIGQHYVEPIQLCDLAKVACVSKCHGASVRNTISPHLSTSAATVACKAMLREGTCITHIAQGVDS